MGEGVPPILPPTIIPRTDNGYLTYRQRLSHVPTTVIPRIDNGYLTYRQRLSLRPTMISSTPDRIKVGFVARPACRQAGFYLILPHKLPSKKRGRGCVYDTYHQRPFSRNSAPQPSKIARYKIWCVSPFSHLRCI